MLRKIGILTVSLSLLLTVGCTSKKNPDDPYEGFNRASFRLNDKLDKVVLRPVAKVYNKIMPGPLNKGLDNMFGNLNDVASIFNDVLQANFYQATSDSWRFAVNSTVGIAGFFDVASKIGLEKNKEDFGLTLAQWGYEKSNFLLLPFLGPRTIRDAIGLPIDYYMTIYPYVDNVSVRRSVLGYRIVDKRAGLLRFQKLYDELAFDPYIFTRNAYLQRRDYLIRRNKNLSDPYTELQESESQDDYYLDE